MIKYNPLIIIKANCCWFILVLLTPRSQSRWWKTWPESEPRDPRRNATPGWKDRAMRRQRISAHSLICKSKCCFLLTNTVQLSINASIRRIATATNSWLRHTIASLAHPPLCPLLLLTVNKGACDSGESAEPCELPVVIKSTSHMLAVSASRSQTLASCIQNR